MFVSAEKKRLTYAWRLHHLLSYNAHWQRLYADILQALIIVLTVLATITSVIYSYLSSKAVNYELSSYYDDVLTKV